MERFLRFITRLDSRAVRAVWITLVLFGLVAALFVVGRFVLDIEPNSVRDWFASASSEWYALPATIALFTVLAFVGAPQFALIGAAVFAFGPVLGFLYSWIATVISASVNFWLGRFLGADTVRRYGGKTVNRISAFVGRKGFWASLIVRIVPSAPFIVVNMAAGVSRMGYLPFVAGLGVGIVPKTVIIAFFGGSLMGLFAGGGWGAGLALAAAAAAWIGFMLYARKLLRSDEGLAAPEPAEPNAETAAEQGEAAERSEGARLAKEAEPSHKEHT
ncbi:MAG: TVP38/TMEM64 family protein [Oceanicaulis sp.]